MMSKKLNLRDRDGELDLSMCSLQEVPVRDIVAVKKATSLDLSNNRITNLGKNFAQLTHIVKLDLSKNSLRSLPENFGDLVQLQHLDLYSNQLIHLPLSFGQLRNLNWLDLSNNPLVPALAEVAGSCEDNQNYRACAVRVVHAIGDAKQRLENGERKLKEAFKETDMAEKGSGGAKSERQNNHRENQDQNNHQVNKKRDQSVTHKEQQNSKKSNKNQYQQKSQEQDGQKKKKSKQQWLVNPKAKNPVYILNKDIQSMLGNVEDKQSKSVTKLKNKQNAFYNVQNKKVQNNKNNKKELKSKGNQKALKRSGSKPEGQFFRTLLKFIFYSIVFVISFLGVLYIVDMDKYRHLRDRGVDALNSAASFLPVEVVVRGQQTYEFVQPVVVNAFVKMRSLADENSPAFLKDHMSNIRDIGSVIGERVAEYMRTVYNQIPAYNKD